MTDFVVTGFTSAGRRVRTIVTADQEPGAQAAAEAMGLAVVRIARRRWHFGSGVRPREMIAILRTLGNLTGLGVPADQAIAIAAAPLAGGARRGLDAARRAVLNGAAPADALASSGLPLPSGAAGILRAAEAVADLRTGLVRAAAALERDEDLRQRLRDALTYPAVLGAASIAAFGTLLLVVVPRLGALIEDFGQQPAWPARVLLTTSRAVSQGWAILAVGAIGGMAAAALVWKRRGSLTRHLRKIPILGWTSRQRVAIRITSILGSMVDAGVPLRAALAHTRRAVGDDSNGAALDAAMDLILQGVSVHAALAANGLVDKPTAGLIAMGESSGQLGPVLLEAGAMLDTDFQRRVKQAVSILEPAIMLLFAGMVAFVGIAMLQALYSLRPEAAT